VQKTVDTIRNLTSANAAPSAAAGTSSSSSSGSRPVDDRSSPLSQHLVLDDGRPYLSYLIGDDGSSSAQDRWQWNRSKYRVDGRSLGDIVDALVKEVASIENAQRNKSQQYAVVKGQVTTALRKKTCVPLPLPPPSPSSSRCAHTADSVPLTCSGNLSMRSLADVVSASDFASTNGSEYLETILVAVPKCVLPLFSLARPGSRRSKALTRVICVPSQEHRQGVGDVVRAVDADGRAEVLHVRRSAPLLVRSGLA